ncbi:omega-hydroxypalmitate O-feruloyl transferase-like [Rhodamnia argentea]|uniref:Omega-hydroxypalmitate O-feruloyl transferase-like n=1 Tax=Rhodamnia argentea TaxID=178133 RepID=A0A8B8PXX9_9MYRT|nr:omega-hydroxypalmitate O-feruloyl transferase-like [Rhodamnia argentea]
MEASTIMNSGPVTVTKSPPILVQPESATPDGFYFLSSLDQAIPITMQAIYCYERSGDDVGDMLKKALAKVLVHYYPLAGKLATTPEDKLAVACTKGGATLVEAIATCGIDALGDVRVPDPDISRKLVYTDPSMTDLFEVPLLTAQVTKFQCGGFTLGIAMSHCVTDGAGAMAFINSWAQTARGVPITIVPFHDRSILKPRVPPQIKYPYEDFVVISDVSDMATLFERQPMTYQAFHFDSDKLAALKRMAMSEDGLTSCTSFTALAAHVWRARSQALNMKPHQLTKLRIMADFRSKFETTALPEGYFGNAVTTVGCLCTAGDLAEKPISFAVEQIKNAVESVTEDYVLSRIDYEDVYKPQLTSVGTLVISSWTRLAFGAANFGWGGPAQFGSGSLVEELGLFMPEGEGKKGIVVVLGLPTSAMNSSGRSSKVASTKILCRSSCLFHITTSTVGLITCTN